MSFDAMRADLTIGVLGAGAMGRGIVQVAAAGGINVFMMDARAGAAEEAREFIGKMLQRAAEKGSMSKDDAAAALATVAALLVAQGGASVALATTATQLRAPLVRES